MAVGQHALALLARNNTSKATNPKENTISVYQGTLHIVDSFTGETVAFSDVDEIFSFGKNKLATDTFQMYIDKGHIITHLSAFEIHQKILNKEWKYKDKPRPKTISLKEGENVINELKQQQIEDCFDWSKFDTILNANPGAKKYMN